MHLPQRRTRVRTQFLDQPFACLLVGVERIGLPATAVPLGLSTTGLPIGAQIVAPAFGDIDALRFAQWLERGTLVTFDMGVVLDG